MAYADLWSEPDLTNFIAMLGQLPLKGIAAVALSEHDEALVHDPLRGL